VTKKRVYCSTREVSMTCGVGVVGDFNFTESNLSSWYTRTRLRAPSGGTGFFIAGFIETSECEEAYKQLCKKHTLIYQSPVRINRNSHNQFFFCIFDRK
jgi:hypothetical protein